MRRMHVPSWVVVVLIAGGCSRAPRGEDAGGGAASPPVPAADAVPAEASPAPAKTLVIRWQRLVVDGGATCPRCAGTESAIREAERTLAPALSAAGVRLVVETGELDLAAFQGNPSESNRIWIGGRTLEEILGGSSGSSQCCGVCGASECRTFVLEGRTYESIPAELIVRAAWKAAAELVGPGVELPAPAPVPVEPAGSGGSCCGAGALEGSPPPPQPPAPSGSCCGAGALEESPPPPQPPAPGGSCGCGAAAAGPTR